MNKNILLFGGLLAGLCLLVLISLSSGRFSISIPTVVESLFLQNDNTIEQNIIWNLRLPRIIGAILVGAALSIAGITYQGIFRNPLVSSDILGVSNGACLGTAIAILANIGIMGIQLFAFVGGLIAVSLTVVFPRLIRRDSTIVLVLAGIIVSGFMVSLLGLMKYIADPESELADIIYWQLGSLTKVDYQNLGLLAPVIGVSAVLLFAMRWRINLLSLGAREAQLMGVNVRFERNLMITLATLLTASSVCLSGTIGWVSLIIPHISRLLIGDNNLQSLPLAGLIGAIFLLAVDTLSRNIYIQEIPLGIITGFIGAPFFAWILIKHKVAN